MNNNIDEYIDFTDKNCDYIDLLENYSRTEIYFEIVHFMNWFYPEWNSNYGIGEVSAEFILTAIQNLEFLENFNKKTTFKNLKAIYLELAHSYSESKAWYQSTISERIYNKFNKTYPDEFDLNELSEIEYEELYNEFSAKEMINTYYKF